MPKMLLNWNKYFSDKIGFLIFSTMFSFINNTERCKKISDGYVDRLFNGELEMELICDLEFDGINRRDYPDFSDAYLASGRYGDRDLTDKELNYLNDKCRDFLYEKLWDYLH